MGLITSAGIGSGIDVEKIISAILNAERAPKEASLLRNEARVKSTLSALGQLSSALTTLDTALNDLNTLSDFKIRSATSSNTAFLTSTASTAASSGSFSIIIDSLAQGSRSETTPGLFANVTDTVGSGTLTLTAGTNTFDVVVGVTDTLETIRDAINSASNNFGVNVNIINGASGPILSYTSSITGNSNSLAVTTSDVSLDSISTNLTSKQTANSASAQVDGIVVTSSSNTFTNAIQDISFTAVKVTDVGVPIILDVSVDKATVKGKIQTFVTALNDFQSISAKLGQSSADSTGSLAGDVTLRLLDRKIKTVLQNTVTGLTSNTNSLNSLGITFNNTGTLVIDETILDSILTTNFDGIADVFASTNGVSVQLQSTISSYLGSGSVIKIREDSLNDQKRRLETDRLNFEYRIGQLETQLRRKFGAMDSIVAKFNNTGSFLTQQLANLPGSKSK